MLGEALCEFMNDVKPRSCKPLKSKGPLTELYNMRAFSQQCTELGIPINTTQINIHTLKQQLIPLFQLYSGDAASKLDERLSMIKKDENKDQDVVLVLDAILQRLERLEVGLGRLPSNITVMESLQDFESKENVPNMAYDEFLKSEKDYCQDLQTFDKVYLTEIRNRHLLHPNVASELENSIRTLIELSDSLGKLIEDRKNLECLGEIDTSSFEIFKEYANTFSEVTRVFEVLKKKNENNEFFELWRKPESKGQTLESYLIKPIQRLCRYPLLLKEYAKDMPDSKSIFEVISAVQKFIDQVNEITESATDDKMKYTIQNKLKDSVFFTHLDYFKRK